MRNIIEYHQIAYSRPLLLRMLQQLASRIQTYWVTNSEKVILLHRLK